MMNAEVLLTVLQASKNKKMSIIRKGIPQGRKREREREAMKKRSPVPS